MKRAVVREMPRFMLGCHTRWRDRLFLRAMREKTEVGGESADPARPAASRRRGGSPAFSSRRQLHGGSTLSAIDTPVVAAHAETEPRVLYRRHARIHREIIWLLRSHVLFTLRYAVTCLFLPSPRPYAATPSRRHAHFSLSTLCLYAVRLRFRRVPCSR